MKFWSCMPLIVAVFSIASCDRDEISSVQTAQHYDHGIVNVEDGPAIFSHDFIVKNTTSVPMKVERIVSSCGCLEADLEPSSIEPGGRGILAVKMKVAASGRRREVVSVWFKRHGRHEFTLEATGRINAQLLPSKSTVSLPKQRVVELDLTCVVDFPEHALPVEIVFPRNVMLLTSDPWTVLEPTDPAAQRQGRSQCRIQLDFNTYEAEFPVVVLLREEWSGAECTIRIVRLER